MRAQGQKTAEGAASAVRLRVTTPDHPRNLMRSNDFCFMCKRLGEMSGLGKVLIRPSLGDATPWEWSPRHLCHCVDQPPRPGATSAGQPQRSPR